MRTVLFAVTTIFSTIIMTTVSQAQAPTPAQQQAIRSNCVSDYRANCAGVPTGGMDALICLEQHEAKLSPACKSAVEAVDHTSASASPAAAKPASSEATATAAAPKASAPKAAAPAAPAGHTMSLRQEMRLAARSCRHDFRVLCPNLPVGQGNVLFCLKVHANRLSTPCRNALIEAGEVL